MLLGPTRDTNDEYDRSYDWYQYLWSKLSASWEHFEHNNLRVISFNYDRSLEEYLTGAMMHTFGKERPDCEAKLLNLSIEHVYGSVTGPYGLPVEGNVPANLGSSQGAVIDPGDVITVSSNNYSPATFTVH
jgi:hypothetical protein